MKTFVIALVTPIWVAWAVWVVRQMTLRGLDVWAQIDRNLRVAGVSLGVATFNMLLTVLLRALGD